VVVTGANVFLETVRGVSVCGVCCVVMFGLLPFIFFLYNEAQLSCVFEKKKYMPLLFGSTKSLAFATLVRS
jgi:hypothetical protein